MDSLPEYVVLFNEYHALIVSVGLALAARTNMDFIDLWRTMDRQLEKQNP